MLVQTVNRLDGLVPVENVFVVTNSEQRDAVLDTCPDLLPERVVGEPEGRDTAAAVALSALLVQRENPSAAFAMLPADHVIEDGAGFRSVLKSSFETAERNDFLVTIGIKPTFPSTGYGYLCRGVEVEQAGGRAVSRVDRFVEKPDLPTAEEYLQEGGYFWNAGMFVWRASRIMDCIKRHLPTHYDVIHSFTGKGIRAAADVCDYYSQLESISIDYGVLEHEVDNMVLIPAQFQWDDIGSWSSLAPHFSQDSNQNASKHDLMAHHSHRNLVMSPKGKKVVLAHVDDLIIVDTDDALLILPKEHDQAIKDIYDKLESEFQ